MLLWLEEAAIEIVMILAVAIGLFMLVAAVWSHVSEALHARSERRPEPTPGQSVETTDAIHRSSGHPA